MLLETPPMNLAALTYVDSAPINGLGLHADYEFRSTLVRSMENTSRSTASTGSPDWSEVE